MNSEHVLSLANIWSIIYTQGGVFIINNGCKFVFQVVSLDTLKNWGLNFFKPDYIAFFFFFFKYGTVVTTDEPILLDYY